jgi:glycerophosphoryl diester phosphodiesterase
MQIRPPTQRTYIATKNFLIANLLLLALPAANSLAKEAASFHIQAHRGAGIAFPENTLETFEQGWKLGVTPESDLRTTQDGTIVCFHDPDFKRVPFKIDNSLKTSSVEKLPLATIEKFDVGSFRGPQFAGQRIPMLSRVFAAMRGRPEGLLYLDIKSVDLDKLAALVHKHKVERQIIFTSEHHRLIRDWRKRIPESLTLIWNRGSEKQLTKKMTDLRKTGFDGITHLQIHVKVGDLNSAEPFTPPSPFLKKIGGELKSKSIVFQVLPWECSDERAFAKLLDLGVESFATDYPEVCLRAVRHNREKSHLSGFELTHPQITLVFGCPKADADISN